MLEGLEPDAAAEILGLPRAVLETQIAAARASLRHLMPARVMIIEDTPVFAHRLTALVAELGHDVCPVAADVALARTAAVRFRPDLILADVDPGEGGIGVSAALRLAGNGPVVFVTGRPDLLEAELGALVVRKLCIERRLTAVIGQALAKRWQNGHTV